MRTPTNACFIADDLSGALEVGGLWHEQGHPVRLFIDPIDNQGQTSDRVFGYDLDTRQMTAAGASRAVSHCIRQLATQGQDLLYKKVDSTLRGWIRIEIEAILDAGWSGFIVFCPANPAAGRTIENGRLLVDGVPVDQTALSRDPAFPVTDARLANLFSDDLKRLHRHGDLDTVRAPQPRLEMWMDQAIDSGARILSFDAVSQLDLEATTRVVRNRPGNALLCGSGALAAAMGRGIPKEPGHGRPDRQRPAPNTPRRIAFLIGSAHPKTRDQFETLAQSRAITTVLFDPLNPSDWKDLHQRTFRQMDAGPVAILPAVTDSGIGRKELARAIQDFYGQWSRTDGARKFGRFFITGGETARTVMNGLGVKCLDLVGNLEPGVAITVNPDTFDPFTLVTKPGGYGHPETLVNCYDYLTR